MSLLKVNEIQIFNGETVTITAPAVVTANDNTNAALRITQTGTGNALVVEDSANPDSSPFLVNALGNVVSGYTASITNIYDPQTTTARTISLEQVGTASTNSGIASISYSAVAGDAPFYGAAYYLARSKSATKGTPGVLAADDIIGSIVFSGDDGTNFVNAAQIRSYVDGTPGTNDMPGRLVFYTTADGARSPTERMRIDSSGNVGIGTSSPSQKLDVTGNINATGALTLGTALAIAEGGTGATDAATARTNLDVDQAGTDNSTDVTLVTTSHDYLSITDQAITLGPIDLAVDVTGTLATSNGGTGVTALSSLDAADLGSGAATDGYVLTADGAGGAAWEAASGGGGGTTAYLEHSSTISDSFTVTSGTNRMYIGGTTFSGTISVAGRLAIVAGPANFTGTINITGTLATV